MSHSHEVVDEKSQLVEHEMGSPTLTYAQTASEGGDAEKDAEKDAATEMHYQRTNERASIDTHDRPHYLTLPREEHEPFPSNNSFASPSRTSRDQATQLVDDLTLLQAERAVSRDEAFEMRRSASRVRTNETKDSNKEDVFNQPTHQPSGLVASPLDTKKRGIIPFFTGIKKIPRVVRYALYAIPIGSLLLIPILLGKLLPDDQQGYIGGKGGVRLMWLGIWLEIVWCSLWLSRMVTSLLPFAAAGIAKVMGSGNSQKWKDAARALELHFGLFLWMLANLISFLPIMNTHRQPGAGVPDLPWVTYLYKVIISIFVLAGLNVIEKIIMQWVANTFHMRTYSLRIETNKQSIAYLVHLYEHTKHKIADSDANGGDLSGSKTPMGAIQENARGVVNRVGDIANRVAGDFTGREVRSRFHPRKVVSELLRETASAQVLARRLFRAYAKEDSDLLLPHDLRPAFPSDEDAEAAFSIFDRDLNGDVSMEELEAFCDEVHREKKAIAASLKDLDSVITKLDRVFFVIILIISIIVLISIISDAAAAALASLGTVVLGLAWMLQATAQEFLQSIIFVFVKHPFDVGDRVTIYGNAGVAGMGDDYYVTEISLLYTEFKKMQGHIVQAPNSTLNTLFILNHRRSGALADVFELQMKYGTPSSVIKELEARMSEFVLANKRDYTNKILTEVSSFEDTYRMRVNFICFHKTSFQNELIRLIRHNRFSIELMNQMVSLGIEQPRQQIQVGGRDYPVYQANVDPPSYEAPNQQPKVDPSILQATRRRANSRANQMETGDLFQDVFMARRPSNAAQALYHRPTPRIAEEVEYEATASGANLRKIGSNDTRRSDNTKRSIFSRSKSTVRRRDESRDRDMV